MAGTNTENSTLISQKYIELNKELHKLSASYGTSGQRYAKPVMELYRKHGLTSILDYGCGKGTLKKELKMDINEYDPCVKGKEAKIASDLLVCTDVLEHVEPECIDAVLDDIAKHAIKYAYLAIAFTPAKKTLSDGRNAHLIVQNEDWWLPKLRERFEVESYKRLDKDIVYIVKAKDGMVEKPKRGRPRRKNVE